MRCTDSALPLELKCARRLLKIDMPHTQLGEILPAFEQNHDMRVVLALYGVRRVGEERIHQRKIPTCVDGR